MTTRAERRRATRVAGRPERTPPPPPAAPRHDVSLRRRALVAVVLAALAASFTSLGNGIAYDDQVLISKNASILSLLPPWEYFRMHYWEGTPGVPAEEAYRPLTKLLLALQHALGGGSPLVFHATTVLLKLAVAGGFLLMALELLPFWPAVASALVVATHPVHNEAVGTIVGQGELHVALAAVLAILVYVRARRRDHPASARTVLALAGLAAYGAFSKEQGVLLPATLLAFEVLAVRDRGPLANRLWTVLVLLGPVVLVVAAAWVLRSAVLADLPGRDLAPVAWVWRGVPLRERWLAGLGLVPDVVRLMIWPFDLNVNYAPATYGPARSFGAAQWMGVTLLAALALLATRTVRRAPVVAAGLAWAVITYLPFSHLLIPSPVVLAERNLFQPTLGAALALGALAALVLEARPLSAAALRAVAAAGAMLVAAFAWRSAQRMPVWGSNDRLLRQMLLDDPRNYFAHFSHGLYYESVGRVADADSSFATAVRLFDRDARALERYAGFLAQQGQCDRSVPLLRRTLEIEETRPAARVLLHRCLVTLGRDDEATAVERRGRELGTPGFVPRGRPRAAR